MLAIKWIRDNVDAVRTYLADRGAEVDLDRIVELDDRRRTALQEVESLRNRRNEISKEVGRLKRTGEDAEHLVGEMGGVGQRIKDLEASLRDIEPALDDLLLRMPTAPHASVPAGRSSEDNPVVRTWGEPGRFDFEPLPHWEVGERLGILDFERAAKIAGARFVVLKGLGSRLERALIQFMLDLHTREHGYLEVLPPFMVNAKAMTGTGQLPKFEEDLFRLAGTDY